MLVVDNRLVFAHVPKTGGTFVGRVLRASGAPVRGATGGHATPPLKDHWSYFTFVRHPASFLTSLWYHRKRWGFRWGQTELERRCGAGNLDQFISNVCKNKGVVWRYFEQHLRPLLPLQKQERLYIGKTEIRIKK